MRGDRSDDEADSPVFDVPYPDRIVSPRSHTAFGDPYAIEPTEPESDGTAVLTETASEGIVAGPRIRDSFEQAAGDDEPPVWVGYDETVYRGVREAPLPFESLFRHVWVSGTTGYGKSTLLSNMLVQYAYAGYGFVYVDPKGADSRDLLRKLPAHRLDDVVWVEPRATAAEQSIGLNLLEVPACSSDDRRSEEIELRLELLSAVLDTTDYWGVDMETITASMGRAMMQSDKPYSVVDLYFTLLDRDARFEFADDIDDPYVHEYCLEIARMDDETVRPLLKRIKSWVESPAIRQLVAHRESTVDFHDLVANDRIVIVRSPTDNAALTKLVSLAVLRNVWGAVQRRYAEGNASPYFVICDEFDAIASENLDVEAMLARARAMNLSVTLSTQYPSQIDPETRTAMGNNCDTLLAFSVNDRDDARVLMERFPDYSADDLLETDRYRCWTRLPLEAGRYSQPVCLDTFPPYPPLRPADAVGDIIERSLERYGAEPLSDDEILRNPLTGYAEEAKTDTHRLAELMAESVRAVQIRRDVREDNGWVPVDAVDDELETRLARDDRDLSYDPADGSDIRDNSELLHTQTQDGELVTCLSDTGAATAALDTGTKRAAGGDEHDSMLADAERVLTKRGFSVDILEQDGRSMPDGVATHPQFDAEFAIEAEHTTTTRPAGILQNLKRALDNGRIPLFFVRGGDPESKYATKLENSLSPPFRQMADGSVRYYNRNRRVTFGGGASARGGVTGVRPVTAKKNVTVWNRDGDVRVLSDGDSEFARIPLDEKLSRDRLPAYYSYDRETETYTVHNRGETHMYDSKDDFEAAWSPISYPFVPELELPDAYSRDHYVIVITPVDGEPVLFRDGEMRPFSIDVGEEDWWSQATGETRSNPRPDSISDDDQLTLGSDSDGVEAFARRYLRTGSEATVRFRKVYRAYTSWAADHNVEPTTKRWFTRKATNVHDFESKKIRTDLETVHRYEGVTLTEAGEAFLED